MAIKNLNRKLDRLDYKKKRGGKRWLKVLIVLLIFIAITYLPVRGIYFSLKELNAGAKGIAQALNNQNLDEMRQHISDMEGSARKLNLSVNGLIWLKAVPFVSGYYSDIQHFSSAASNELHAAKIIADSLDPYKAELGFTGTPTPGQDRVAQAVKILEKTIPQLDKVEPDLVKAGKEVESIDVGKYPEKFGNYKVRTQVEVAKNFITGAAYAVTQARPALEQAPSALGQPNAKTYLLLFQNDKEIRATGGFLTAFAFLKIDHGKLTTSNSDDIYRLDERLLNVCKSVICPLTPPAAIAKYLPEADGKPRTAWSLRDSNFSPDVPTSLKQFEKIYAYLKGESFDGVILIDTNVLVELLKVTGPIEVNGTTYSAESEPKCSGCPNVVYELLRYVQIIEKGEADRKEVLGTLMQQILARSLGAEPAKIPEFINAGVKLANQKDLMLYMHDQKTQTALANLNWTGEIRATDGDYLHINDSNFAGGKTNLYVEQKVTYDINPDKKHVKLTIEYKNPKAFTSWLNTINRNYVRVYVPDGATLTRSKGSDSPVEDFTELGKTVFDGFVQVRPQNSRTLELEYDLPQNYAKDGKYQLYIQKQPGSKNHQYTIKVNGRTKETFDLTADRELKLSL